MQVASADWPAKVCQNHGHGPQGHKCVDARKYAGGVIVASPQNMTRETLDQVRADVPGSKVVAYFDFGDVPLAHGAECPFCHGHIMGDRPGRNCSTTYSCGPLPFLSALQAVRPSGRLPASCFLRTD